jgi:ABC-type sugar transport system ATPase subunit
VRAGELVGLFGLPGSGASDILRAVAGADPTATGTVMINGAQAPKTVRRRIERGLAYVSGDRGEALVADLSVAANIALPCSGHLARAIATRRESRTARAYIRALDIRPPAPQARVSTLSGGNQQKVIIARWLARDPRVWLLDDPTRGVDATAQAAIHRILRDRVRGGACGLMSSSDPGELHEICDRGLLITRGRITAEIDPRRLDPGKLSSLLEGDGTECACSSGNGGLADSGAPAPGWPLS